MLFLFDLFHLPTWNHHFIFGWEMGEIAHSLVTGHGYSSPFGIYTGPTAWTAPLYPFWIAAIFRIFGIYSKASVIVLMTVNAAFVAMTVLPVWEIACRCFSRKVASISVWMWALWPFTLPLSRRIWVSALAAFLFTMIFALTLRMRGIGEKLQPLDATATPRLWLLLGLLWGVLAISMASFLVFMPVSFLWLLWPAWQEPGRPQFKKHLQRAILAVVLCIAFMTPWMIRNALVFHKFIPMRSNFGVELYLGNGPQSTGIVDNFEYPATNQSQLYLYRHLGEIAYCHLRGEEAMAFIRAHPLHYAADSLLRIGYYWFGTPASSNPNSIMLYLPEAQFAFFGICGLLGLWVALRDHAPGIQLFVIAFLVLPDIYYFVHVQNRFRYSLDPLLYCLTLYLWMSAEESNRVRWLTPGWWRQRFSRHP